MSGQRIYPCDLAWLQLEIGCNLLAAVAFPSEQEAMEFFQDGDIAYYSEEYGWIVAKPIPIPNYWDD